MSTAFAQTADCMIQERYDVFILGSGSLVRSEGHTSANCWQPVWARTRLQILRPRPFNASFDTRKALHRPSYGSYSLT
jgi:hypothetical protein